MMRTPTSGQQAKTKMAGRFGVLVEVPRQGARDAFLTLARCWCVTSPLEKEFLSDSSSQDLLEFVVVLLTRFLRPFSHEVECVAALLSIPVST